MFVAAERAALNLLESEMKKNSKFRRNQNLLDRFLLERKKAKKCNKIAVQHKKGKNALFFNRFSILFFAVQPCSFYRLQQ